MPQPLPVERHPALSESGSHFSHQDHSAFESYDPNQFHIAQLSHPPAPDLHSDHPGTSTGLVGFGADPAPPPEQDFAAGFDLSFMNHLTTQDNTFWSSFLASPPDMAAASTSLLPKRRRPRIMITATGMPSRHASPGLSPEHEEAEGTTHETSRTWPAVWNPTGEEANVELDDGIATQSPMGIDLASCIDLPAFNDEVRMALLETLRFSHLSDEEYHALYGTISKVPLVTLGKHPVPPYRHRAAKLTGHVHPAHQTCSRAYTSSTSTRTFRFSTNLHSAPRTLSPSSCSSFSASGPCTLPCLGSSSSAGSLSRWQGGESSTSSPATTALHGVYRSHKVR